jgi:hypothetical protein
MIPIRNGGVETSTSSVVELAWRAQGRRVVTASTSASTTPSSAAARASFRVGQTCSPTMSRTGRCSR